MTHKVKKDTKQLNYECIYICDSSSYTMPFN